MSQPVLLSQLNDEAKKQLIAITLKNDSLQENSEAFSNMFGGTTWLLIGKTLVNAGYTPFVEYMNIDESLKRFLEFLSYTYLVGRDGDIIKVIREYAENYLTGN